MGTPQNSVPPPPDAVVLFDGTDTSEWVHRSDGAPCRWRAVEGALEVVPGTGDILTKRRFGDFELHLEFWLPLMADQRGQARANSGLYLQGLYEIQILDSYNNETYPLGVCAALYNQFAPSQNAALPPEQWQT
ncbi:MAG: 3-keto-disaccharide hydrolase, partial [Armatimonadota bacterium]